MTTPVYKQVIIVRSDYHNEEQKVIALSKASIMLVTRCMDGMKNFIGKSEVKEYQKVLMSWINDNNAEVQVKLVPNAEIMDTCMWTAEMMGIPCQTIQDNTQNDVCCAIGPEDSTKIDQLLSTML